MDLRLYSNLSGAKSSTGEYSDVALSLLRTAGLFRATGTTGRFLMLLFLEGPWLGPADRF